MTVKPRPPAEYESLPAASHRVGLSIPTLRAKIADGSLKAYRVTQKPGAAIRVRVSDVNDLFKPVVPEDFYPGNGQLAVKARQ